VVGLGLGLGLGLGWGGVVRGGVGWAGLGLGGVGWGGMGWGAWVGVGWGGVVRHQVLIQSCLHGHVVCVELISCAQVLVLSPRVLASCSGSRTFVSIDVVCPVSVGTLLILVVSVSYSRPPSGHWHVLFDGEIGQIAQTLFP
jgi:hypothetical protein